MAIAYKSMDVKEIFPSTKTKTINKLITENSLTRLLNRLVDVDGYIISSELGVDVSDDNEYTVIEGDGILDSDLEFCIRGYYFNLGTFSDVCSKIIPQVTGLDNVGDNVDIYARIYIDEISNPEYPELYGYDDWDEYNITIDVNTRTAILNADYDGTTIKFYNNNGERVYKDWVFGTDFIINTNNIICDINGGPIDLFGYGVNTVNYFTHTISNAVWIHMANEDLSLEGLSPDLTPYELLLFNAYRVDDAIQLRIPISSFHKFSSVSVKTVDGGVIE